MPRTSRSAPRRLTIQTLEERAVPAVWTDPVGVGFTEPEPALAAKGTPQNPTIPDAPPPPWVPVALPGNVLVETSPTGSTQLPQAYDDYVQGRLDNCVLNAGGSATAQAQEAFDIGLVIPKGPREGSRYYQVKLFKPNSQGVLTPHYETVEFDGTIYPDDPRPADDQEYWTALVWRAYKQLSDSMGADYRNLTHAMRSITGAEPEKFDPAPNSRPDAQRLLDALNQGRPVIAGTIGLPDDPAVLDAQWGIISFHAYTVMGVELPPSGTDGAWVTLRNPWGRDNHWAVYDGDANGELDLAEWFAFKSGLDGTNDGVIRVPWAVFAQYFSAARIGPALAAESINMPQPANGRPVFANPNPGPFTIREGETLSVNLPATDPEGNALFYSVVDGPGYVQVQTGAYSWLPTSNDLGRFSITVKAETTYAPDCNTVTFIVDVTSGRPRIQSLTASTYTVTDAGTDPLVLTANGVVHDFDDVDFVEFYRDLNGNGTLEPATDFLLRQDGDVSDGWSWNGQLTGVTPGNYKVFARAARYSFSDLFYSNVVDATIAVTAAPPVEEVAVKAGGETTVVTDNAGVWPVQVTKDAAGNSYVFYNRGGSARLVRYTAAGALLAGETTLVGANAVDVAMQPSGAFVLIWEESNTLYARRHNPDGTTPTGAVLQVSDTGVIGGSGGSTGFGRVAVNASGTFIVAWVQGSYFSEFIAYRRFQGDTPQSPANPFDGGGPRAAAPGVAIDAAGNSLIGWSSYGFDHVAVRRLDAAGVYTGQFYPSAFGNKPSGDLGSVSVGWLPDGGFVAAWSDGSDVYVRRAAADGEFSTANPVRVNAVTTGTQEFPRLAVTPAGHSAVLWQSQGQDPGDGTFDWGVYGQVFGHDGRALGPNFRVPTTTTSSQHLRGVAADAGLDFTAVWGQLDPNVGSFGTITNIRMQRFAVDLAPVVSASPAQAVGRQAKRTMTVPAVDPDGQPVTVIAINGTAIASGGSVDLPSGARVTRNANGTLTYEPRNAVAVGTVDSFAYTVGDGTKTAVGAMSFRVAGDLDAKPAKAPDGNPAVRFSEKPANHATALQLTVKGVGPDGLLGTADDATAAVTPAWNDTTLVLPGLAAGLYRVTIDDALADETGRLLDGDGNGTPGGDYVRDFVVRTPGAAPDGSFGTGGGTVTNVGNHESQARAMVVQPDGKILVAGYGNNSATYFDFALARYLPDGTLDPTFGTGGVVQTDFGANKLDLIRRLALQPDGKIIAVGETASTNFSDHAFAVARYLPDGTLDPTFDGDGRATIDFGGSQDRADDVVVLPDGKILVSGRAAIGTYDAELALVRLTATGALDVTFDGDGRVVTPQATVTTHFTEPATAFRRLATGRLVVAQVSSNLVTVARYLTNGALDTAFGTAGVARTTIAGPFYGQGVSVLADGGVLVGGWWVKGSDTYAAVAKLLPTGAVDGSFGTSAVAVAVAPGPNDRATEATVLADGSVLATGRHFASGVGYQASLFKFRPDGTPDAAFGTNGLLGTADAGGGIGYALAVGPDGRAVVAGETGPSGYEFAVWRTTVGATAGLTGANGFAFDIDPAGVGAGQVSGAGLDAYTALRVSGTDFAAALAANGSADGGHTLLTGTQSINLLDVRREVTVPTGDGVSFARTVDVFSNASGEAISTTVRYASNLGSDAATVVFATSDGDTIVEPTDWWVATDDANGTGSPAVVHVLGGPRGLRPASVQLTGDSLVWSYNLNVADGETVRLATFAIPAATRAQALAALDTVITRTGFAGAGGQFLDAGELASLENVVFLNAPTAAGPLNDVTGNEDAAIAAIPLRPAFADVEDGAAGLTYTVVSVTGVPGLVTGTVNPDTDVLTLTPGLNAHGSATVTVRATDTDGLWFDRTFDVTLDPVADAPLTDVGRLLMLPSVAKNATNPPGVSVATLLRNSTNPDGSAAGYGIAVTGLGGVAGRWESATAVGGLWTQITGASDTNALLLPRTAVVRFVPNKNITGHAGLQFRAWDGVTSATNVTTAPQAFSANEVGWVPVGVASPTFDTSGRAVTRSLAEDTIGKGIVAKTVLGLLAAEFPAGTPLGLAITGATGNGAWQVKVGKTWQPIADPTESAARLLKATDQVRFVPAADWSGEATLTYRAWKVPTTGVLPTVGDVTADPASYSVEELSAVATVTPVNDAPTLTTSLARAFGSDPRAVIALLDGAADVDGEPTGIAVTRAAAKNGTWEYRLTAAAAWTAVGKVSASKALLLGPTAEVRFVPTAGATVGGGSFDYKVVDDSITFANGARQAATSSAFSKVVETATAAFGNAAPTFKPGPAPAFTAAVRAKGGYTVSGLLGRMTDTAGFQKGLAVTATAGTGTWEFSLDGGRTWQAVGSLGGQRLLLRSSDRVRFTPAAGFTGPAGLTFAAWDRTLGVAGDRPAGPDESQSVEELAASLTVA